MNKIFLGGTCAETTWRNKLKDVIQVDFFDPVVEDWTQDCIEIENDQKNNKCNIHLFVITSDMEGVYSIAEAVQSSMTDSKIVIFHVLPNGFTTGQLRSLQATCDLISSNGGIAYIDGDLYRTSRVINNCFK